MQSPLSSISRLYRHAEKYSGLIPSPRNCGEPALVAIHDMQENTQAIFLIHPEYRRGALTSERMHEKRFGSYQMNKVAERINESTASPVIDSVRRWQMSIFVNCQTEAG